MQLDHEKEKGLWLYNVFIINEDVYREAFLENPQFENSPASSSQTCKNKTSTNYNFFFF